MSGSQSQPVTRRHLCIGHYDVYPVPTGVFGLDGGAMFGTVPKVLWEKTNPADEHNRIRMEARALLLDGTGPDGVRRRILVDCGIGGDFNVKYGEKLGSKFAEMYAVDASVSLEGSLGKLGLTRSDITHVILTHLHFDHSGGATRAEGGKLVPTFPNARYFVQKANVETARKPNVREKASYFDANFAVLLDSNVVELLDGDREELLPGVSVFVSNGHTRGQQIVRVSGGKDSLLYCGDLIPTSTHVRLAWVMGYDLDPLTLIEEKRAVLERAAAEGTYLYFEHDPEVDAARVTKVKEDFAVSERVFLE